jgi:hypothetical protein
MQTINDLLRKVTGSNFFKEIRQKIDPNYINDNGTEFFAGNVQQNQRPTTINEVKAQTIKQTPELQPSAQSGFKLQGIPDDIAQLLGSELDKYGLATEAASVLNHPREQTYTPQEISLYGHENWNGGENPQFQTVDKPGSPMKTLQDNGTYDVGLMRENSQTFSELQGSHKWNTILKENGINSLDDINTNPTLSVRYAKILGDYVTQDLGQSRWKKWFAAPLNLRTGQP